MHSIRSAIRSVAAIVALAAVACGAAAGVASATQVEIVTKGTPPATYPRYVHYFSKIQEAVDKAHSGAYVLIEPGVYDEAVKVTKAHSDIFIRGTNRNEVIVDGQGLKVPGGRNGIEIYKANNVWVENLTVRNFDRESLNGSGGNEIWWNGGADSGKVGAHGWYGRYLTAYDTGLDGGYGIFTGNETEGEWENIYASGFNDSGIYIGACQECKARVNKAVMEYNALGYSGSNSGGNLVIENSVFSHNTTGIAPNSENPGDGPPSQNGACEHAPPLTKYRWHGQVNWRGTLPEFKTTEFAHCTIFRDNVISENNDLNLPANTSAAAAPWGAGIELPGVYGDLVEHNIITGNPSNGVLAFEYPNPFYESPAEEEATHVKEIDFQNAGNKVVDNTFSDNGYLGGEFAGDVAFEGGVFGTKTSTNNCISDNSMPDGSYPANIEGTWGCQNSTTPNAGGGFEFVGYLLALQAESVNRPEAEPVPPPPAQPTESEAEVCAGVPANPLCP